MKSLQPSVSARTRDRSREIVRKTIVAGEACTELGLEDRRRGVDARIDGWATDAGAAGRYLKDVNHGA